MHRRTFIGTTAAALLALTRGSEAQPVKVPLVGFLGNADASSGAPQRDAFLAALRTLGWVEGRTVAVEYRWAEGRTERIPALVADLVAAKVDVIALSGPVAMTAAQKATRTIPIVFVSLVDPVAMGFVTSFAHPGGNMTGLASQFEELVTKQLALLKEIVPGLARVAFLRHVEATPSILAAAEAAARGLSLNARTIVVASESDFERAFQTARAERVGAIHVLPSPFLGARRASLIALAARHRLPACYELRIYVADGGLMSYGPSLDGLYGRAASYVDRILKGARPGELAIERPAKFELVLNRRTADALGLPIPPSLLRQADEVIT